MKKKSIIKMIIDILMLILMILEYSKIYTGGVLHEIFGITLLGLFVNIVTSFINNLIVVFSVGLIAYNLEKIIKNGRKDKNGKETNSW